jgi:hypothetical protein
VWISSSHIVCITAASSCSPSCTGVVTVVTGLGGQSSSTLTFTFNAGSSFILIICILKFGSNMTFRRFDQLSTCTCRLPVTTILVFAILRSNPVKLWLELLQSFLTPSFTLCCKRELTRQPMLHSTALAFSWRLLPIYRLGQWS